MKAFNLIAVIVLASTTLAAEFIEECGVKVGVTREQHEAFNPLRDEWSPAEKCYLECDFERSGVMKDGHFSDEFRNYLVKLESDGHSSEASRTKTCVDGLAIQGCEAAYRFGGCLAIKSVSFEFLQTFADSLKSQNTQLPEVLSEPVLAMGGLSEPELAPGSFSEPELAPGSFGEPQLAAGGSTGAELAQGGSTGAELAQGGSTGTELAQGGSTGAELAQGGSTGTELAQGGSTETELAQGGDLSDVPQASEALGESGQTSLLTGLADENPAVLSDVGTDSAVLSDTQQNPDVVIV